VHATVTIPARRTTADVGVWVVADWLREGNERIRFLALAASPPRRRPTRRPLSATNPFAVKIMTLRNDE
jgi:hypothetical protein